MTENRLDLETSPYLLAHAGNPVHWQPWDEDALAEARRENKPILLSVGYAACHWCHVMANESFEDPDTAALMNALFVNIKVDREERPDIDTIYQSALAEMGQTRGWPLTMFLTPKAEPYGGGTYFPPEPAFGRPAFGDLLKAMAEAYAKDPEKAARESARIVETLQSKAAGGGGAEVSSALMNHAANQLLDGVDIVYGEFGQESKFPHTMAQELLWRAYMRSGHESFRKAVLLSAEQMCLGGIYDHLGGGFARYAVDERWLVPHFEKMLYDNALIIDLLSKLWQDAGRALFARRVEESVAWMLREMTLPGGGFAASLAADSEAYEETEGGEGAFYLWREAEIDALLGENSRLFKRYYDVSAEGNWEDGNILNRLDRPFGDKAELELRLADCRSRLLAARETRPRPARDDKRLADWNGLAIAALANAGSVFDRSDWLDAGRAAFDFVRKEMQGTDGRLSHSFRAGRRTPSAILDDYAAMARAALCLFEASGESALLDSARAWVAVCDDLYWDEEGGGYFLTASDDSSIISRIKTADETATPSGNGLMVGVLARLHALTAEPAYRDRARATIAAFGSRISSNPFTTAALINNAEFLQGLVQVVIAGDPRADDTLALIRATRETALPNRLLIRLAPDGDLPAGHPAAGKSPIEGRAAAYLCFGESCRLPIVEAEDLRDALQDRELRFFR